MKLFQYRNFYIVIIFFFGDPQIEYNFSGNYVTIRNIGENYLLLTNNDKNVKFESNNPVSGKLKEIKLNINKEPDRLFFTFSQGKFFLIKDSK